MNGIRRALWTAGAPARWVAIGLIRVYQHTLSGVLGGQCRFSPTCSHYGVDAIRERGVIVGATLTAWRVLRCNPYGKGGLDPAPRRRSYDVSTRGASIGTPGHGARA